jgi:hypothetical protein
MHVNHKVRIALIIVLPPKCCGDFSVELEYISY